MAKFQITVEATHSATDAAGVRRLREYLKRLGRGCGLRCVDVRTVSDAPAGAMEISAQLETAAACVGSGHR